MKKVCILSTVNVKHMTLVKLYTDYMERCGIAYDMIYIDKYGDEEKTGAEKMYRYEMAWNRDWSFVKKFRKYCGFFNFAKRLLQQNDYHFVIVWNSFTALMFAGVLKRHYYQRYCINIRDYCLEKMKPVYWRMKSVVKNSRFTTISSKGFLSFLPPYDYLWVHSLNESLLKDCIPRTSLQEEGRPIRLSFIGNIRFFEQDKRLIDQLGNDDRYLVQYFGQNADIIEDYAKQKNYHNVITHGRFEPEQTKEFLEQTDILNNLYGVGEIALDTAISIRTYYSAYLNMPILVYRGTVMEQITGQYGMGFAVEEAYENLADRLFAWYTQLDFEKLKEGCKRFYEDAKRDNEVFYSLLEKCLMSGNGKEWDE